MPLRRMLLIGIIIAALGVVAQHTPTPSLHSGEQKTEAVVDKGDVFIISDTKGYDFKPYVKRLVDKVRENWYKVVPDEAREPTKRKGVVVLQFAILRDGSIAGLRIMEGSGSDALDRAAWEAVASTTPMEPLPKKFDGKFMGLRVRFRYNP